jgi:hypothetical protein
LSSPSLKRTEEALSIPNETSVLLPTTRAPACLSAKLFSVVLFGRSLIFGQKCRVVTYRSISALSTLDLCVKWLNRLGKHVPVLEVRDTMGAK